MTYVQYVTQWLRSEGYEAKGSLTDCVCERGESKNWIPKQPVIKKYGLLRHPVSPKGVLLRLKVRSSHLRSNHSVVLKGNNHIVFCF